VIHTIDRDGTERWFDLSGRHNAKGARSNASPFMLVTIL
jgi:hypothetical protein